MALDPTKLVRDIRERLAFLLTLDRNVAEVLDLLRDTHRILGKVEGVVDRMDEATAGLDEKLEGLREIELSSERIDRLEEAVLNIERATLGVEDAMRALPKSLQTRIRRARNLEDDPPKT